MVKFGGGEKCYRCKKTVYTAEEMQGMGQKFHKACFTCAECNKSMDSTNVCDNKEDIFCRSCYGRRFGPKGYGYGGGAGTLSVDGPKNDLSTNKKGEANMSASAAASIVGSQGIEGTAKADETSKPTANPSQGSAPSFDKSKYQGKDLCPRCDKQVYFAEKVIGAGFTWHKSCFRCQTCAKSLDSTNCQDRDGQIFCSPCYSKSFGPKGFGIGGAMVHTQ
eukprot:CFRG7521T1